MKWSNVRKMAAGALAVALLQAAPAWAEKFTVAVVPDTQNYADVLLAQPRGEDTFKQQMQYLVDKADEKKIIFATFVGDIVQHGDGQLRQKVEGGKDGEFEYWDTREEWDIANRAVSILSRSSIAFGMSPGNHDYDSYSWWTGPNSPGAVRPLAGVRTWNHYFGPQSRHFSSKPWYGGSFNQGANSYQFFTGGGIRFLHLSLEMEPPQVALDWAQGVLDANPGLPVILTTHEWILPASMADKTARSNGYDTYFKGSNQLPPDEVWNRFVRKNSAIFLVLSGHHFTRPVNGVSEGENLRIDHNDAGYPVYQVLQDYQGQSIGSDGKPGSATGGAGWMRFIEFDTDTRKIHFYTYSTLLNQYAGRDGNVPFGTRASLSDFKLDFPPQLEK